MPNRRSTWRAKSSATKPSSPRCSRPRCASSRGRNDRPAAANGVVDAPDPSAMRGDEEENEAVENSQLPFVLQRPEAAVRSVKHEVRHRHLAAGDERGDAGKETDGDEQSADELDASS